MNPEELLHVAVCQAVAILNAAPAVACTEDGRRVHGILRQSLADYADAMMDQPAQPGEVAHMKKLHKSRTRGVETAHPTQPEGGA